jgi:hypothetical protein
MPMSSERRIRWRERACAYGAAVVLNVALASVAPLAVLPEPVAIVRPAARRRDGFDPREVVDGVVLTISAEAGRLLPPAGGDRFGLN